MQARGLSVAIEKIEVEVADLLFDQHNPRTGSVASQSDALAAIVKLSARNFKNMMQSIRDHGLDPGDSFYLVQEGEEDEGSASPRFDGGAIPLTFSGLAPTSQCRSRVNWRDYRSANRLSGS
jgi:hypothetical protein